MIKYNFKEALELASDGLEPIFSINQNEILDNLTSINGIEPVDNIKKHLTFIAANFAVDDTGELLYTESGVNELRKALEFDISYTHEFREQHGM